MNGSIIRVLIITGVFIAGPAQADIYQWTDKNGVKHFTNYKPPAHATILMKTKEVPYDEAADRARIEADRQYQLELDRLELAKREAEIEQREAAAERKVREAERYADDTRRAADEYLDDSIYDRWYYRSGSWGTYSYGHSRYKRSYYRNHTISIYWRIATASITTNAKITKKAATDTGKIFTANHTAIQSIRVSKDTGHRITCDPAVDAPTAAITATPGAAAGWAGATLAGAPSDAIANPHLDSLIQTDSPKAYFSIITSSQME